ncbi:M48 family metalloprotease [Tenacibaculum sp. 190524A05c]|uniref:M48 family metalloprotease n=1 Tax=Tenacibaculum platacis TaxID=3137852 RepID=UPI0031FA804F
MEKISLKIAILLCVISLNLNAQVFIPKNKEQILQKIEQNYDSQVDLLEGKYRSKIKKEYKKRRELIRETFLDSTFVFDNTYKNFVSSIIKEVKAKNPSLDQREDLVFINRHLDPNAACFGNHTFMFNLGLFHFLESEDEFAFIVCHELAHQYLDHVNGSVRKRVEKLNSKEYRRKIRDARLTIYGRNKAGMKLLKELSYGFLKKSRSKEYEADSLGLVFFKKTKYNAAAASKSLGRLKRFDDGIFNTKIKVDSILNFDGFKFRKYWLEEEETMFDIEEKADDLQWWDKDSIKTHPDIENRVKKLESKITQKEVKPTVSFEEIKAYATKDQINSLIYFNQLDLVFYLLLEKIQKGGSSDFIITKLAETLQKIYTTKVDHIFGKRIPQSSPFAKEKNLNKIRTLLHNLEIRDVRKIGYHFCKKYSNTITSEEFAKINNFFTKLNQ